ncbi:MAG: aldehyde dehydrogenase family protein [Candidatus Nanopelagicales bacterium]
MLTQSDTQTSQKSTQESPQQRLDRIFHSQREGFRRNPNPSAKQRRELMERVPDMLLRNRARILAALDSDLGGSAHTEGDLFDIIGVIQRAQFNIAHVRGWMKPVRKAVNPVTQGNSKAYIKYQPKGVIGNMATWNFPFDIALGPTLDALGAGNRVIIKPSESTPACGQLLTEMIAESFDDDQVAVVTGDVEFAKYFATKPWDHLVYTGGANAGREVMRSAAANLVPVTLELGGRNATIVGRDKITDPTTISVIAGVKALKRGQVCVTSDHCLVPEESLSEFRDALVAHMHEAFGADNAAGSCGIVNDRHVARLTELVDQARDSGAQVIQIGHSPSEGNRLMPFFVIVDPSDDLPLMQQEVFGPILPIKTYRTTQDVIDRVNAGDRPLGLYVFSDDRAFIDEITQHTQSGGVAVNAVAIQAALPSMGFGGVGASGMGRHHGEEGFREFSNPRGFFERGAGGTFELIVPPYREETRELIHDVAYGSLAQQLRFAAKTLPKNLKARFRQR